MGGPQSGAMEEVELWLDAESTSRLTAMDMPSLLSLPEPDDTVQNKMLYMLLDFCIYQRMVSKSENEDSLWNREYVHLIINASDKKQQQSELADAGEC